MGFFDTLRQLLTGRPDWAGRPTTDRERIADAWGLVDADDEAVAAGPMPAHTEPAGAYDRAQWEKKLKRILDELPASREEYEPLMAEARALNFDPEWLARRQREEFALLVRRAVADRHFTEKEHRTLDLARDLIGIPDAEAEQILRSVVADAESFFGESVEGA